MNPGVKRSLIRIIASAPAMRLALAMKAGIADDPEVRMAGKLLEDIAGLYLKRLLPQQNIHYDSKAGGADFVLFNLGEANTAIPVEVGWQKRDTGQVRQTLQTVDGKYGLIITNTELDVDPAAKTIFVPLKYFLLA